MSRFLKRLLLVIMAIVVSYLVHLFYTTGYFRSIENSKAEIVQRIPIVGAEDIQVSADGNFAIISSDDRATRRDSKAVQGHLYYLDLKEQMNFKSKNLTEGLKFPFYPHGINILQIDSITHKILAVNHTESGHSIEVFSLIKDSLVHTQTIKNKALVSPNDLTMVNAEQFYFTNDHGYTKGIGVLAEDYLGIKASNAYFFDGKNFTKVADKIAYANGICFDKQRNLVFIASPRDFLVKVYARNNDGSLSFIEDIPCGTGVDNIEFDSDGNLWIGCHPNLLAFAKHAAGKSDIAPSELIKINYKNTGDYTVESVFLDDGNRISASTVAAPHNNLLFVGSVFDEDILVLKNTP